MNAKKVSKRLVNKIKGRQIVSVILTAAMLLSGAAPATVYAAGDELYRTDFTDLDSWDTYAGNNGADWEYKDGMYTINGGTGNKAVYRDGNFDDFRFDTEVTVNKQTAVGNDKSSAQGGVIFRVQNPSTGADGYDGYFFCIDVQNQKVTFGKASTTGKAWTELASKKMLLEYGVSYKLTVKASGNHMQCFVDEKEGSYAKIDVVDDTFTSGSIGLRNWLSSTSYKSAVVTQYEEPEPEGSTYTNSLLPNCADPDVLYYEGTYYLYCTNAGNSGVGIKVYTSTDLVNWTDKGFALNKGDGCWGTTGFWAPDLIWRDGTFYMYYTANEHICAATSDSPLGPFKQEEIAPMHQNIKEIDAHIFQDDDGQYYMYFVRFNNGNIIWGAKMNDDMMSIDESTLTEVINPSQAWELDMGRIAEGPFMLKKDGTYYLTYSGSHFESPQYGAGYATSTSPLGPFTKYENNPIMQSNALAHGTGHHGIAESPDGTEMFMVYHRHKSLTSTEPRELCIDRMQFTEDAKGNTVLEVKGPTVSPQDVPSGAVDADNFIAFEEPEPVTVKAGSDPKTWELPAEIGVITSKSSTGENYCAKVTWDTSGYDAGSNKEQQLVLKGTVEMPEGVDNLGGLSLVPELFVTVKQSVSITKAMEAEDAALTSPAKVVNRPDASGGKKVGTIDNQEAKVTFTLHAEKAGRYRIDVYSGSGSDQKNASHMYYVNGDTEHAKILKYQAKGWDNWTAYPIEVELKEGLNTLTFTHSGQASSYSELDKIVFYKENPKLESILLNGEAISGFQQDVNHYEVDVDNLDELPKVSAKMSQAAGEGFEISVQEPTRERPEAKVILTHSEDPDFKKIYTVQFFGPQAFSNPLVNYGADPYVTYQDGYYYYCRVQKDSAIYVSRSPELNRIAATQPNLVYAPGTGEPNKELWAPELHYLDGNWYIYYTAGSGANHRMYVLESETGDPLGNYVFKGELSPETNRWAIDQTVLEHNGQLYAIWSGWDGFVNVDQRIYIAKMSDPLTITGDRVELSVPEYAWEKIGQPYINEGAQVVKSPEGVVNVLYSASGSWTDDYCLGRLTLKENGDPMNPEDWNKATEPVFKKNAPSTYSTGHACFTTSPDGSEDYMVYHATRGSGEGWNGRGVRTQRIYWNADGTPDLGEANQYNSKVNWPSGTPVIKRQRYEAENGVLSGNAVSAETYNSSAGRKVTGLSDEQASVELTVNAKSAGTYRLYIGAATSKANAAISVSVNGKIPVDKSIIAFNSSAGGTLCVDNWSGYELDADLNAGKNRISITKSSNSNAADIDYVDVELIEAKTPEGPVDTTSLESLITMLEGMADKKGDYTPASWARMEEELDSARALLKETALTQKAVDDRFLSLMDSYLNLTKVVQKTGLKAAIDYAEAFLADEEGLQEYTEESIATLREALEAAKTVYGTDYADATEGKAAVLKATNALMEATINLIRQEPVDKERLQTLIDYAAAILKDAGHYTSASVKALEDALTSAAEVLEDKKATEEEVTGACKSLSDALLGLVPKSDKTELENAVAMAEKILKNADQYTADSLKGLEESLENARAIYDNEDATQEEVEEALKALIVECMEVRLLGDVDYNGKVDSQDSTAVLKAMAELTELEEGAEQAADVTRDGKVGTDDASRILQYAAELIEKF